MSHEKTFVDGLLLLLIHNIYCNNNNNNNNDNNNMMCIYINRGIILNCLLVVKN